MSKFELNERVYASGKGVAIVRGIGKGRVYIELENGQQLWVPNGALHSYPTQIEIEKRKREVRYDTGEFFHGEDGT